ncbi:large ribosomal subunit protein bL35m [Cylas formicarius]|uniref:large ribosomal subunit protein bL35m n=1 Tax=Cylas formicarius TaxID=197179 RepID=UPI0029589667|nr:large ribosomal subunit protein bL35m [Cylas formicarius]
MLRAIYAGTKLLTSTAAALPKLTVNNTPLVFKAFERHFGWLPQRQNLLSNPAAQYLQNVDSRTVTKYSMRDGTRKSVKAVLRRFYRLNWGAWIRTKAGRHKKLWKKSPPRRRRLRQHVFCNATQSRLLDKMVTSYWKRPKYYVDDIYEPYHTREEFLFTSKKPRPYIPPEQ